MWYGEPSYIGPWWCHGLGVLEIRHHNRWDGQHEATQHLFGVIIHTCIGKANTGTVEGHPSTPLEPHHEATHAEDHAQHIHVISSGVLTWSPRGTLCRRLVSGDLVWPLGVRAVVSCLHSGCPSPVPPSATPLLSSCFVTGVAHLTSRTVNLCLVNTTYYRNLKTIELC